MNPLPSFGVLLMAHGTPESLEQMPEYLTLVRGGRPPSAELIAEITANYAAIGGRSPLTEVTRAQAAALQARLGPRARVTVGMRNWRPFIADALAEMAAAGITRVLGIPLAPQFSRLSVAKYVQAAEAARPDGLRFQSVRSFHDHPLLIEAFAERLRAAAPRDDEEVIFTAHSVPVRIAEDGDPYPAEVVATAAGVAARAELPRYFRAFQSAGRTPEPWLGPDIADLVRERAAAGTRAVVVVPIGFVADHTEILFDIDIQAARVACDAGIALRRTESLNTSPCFIAMLEALAEEHAEPKD
jgi:ferrochelatase